MSISIHSENSKDEIETEDGELEDLVWNLMSRTGLLSQIQGQISKFIENNGKTENTSSIHPDRADAKILGFIFEYLQWVGMKQTNSVLLSEAPLDVDVSVYESREEGPDYRPELCKLFEDHTTEGKGTPTRSHNYSKDEFEDSRLTSASGHQSMKSDNLIEDEVGDSEDDDESYSSHKQSRRKSIPFGNGTEKNINLQLADKPSEEEPPLFPVDAPPVDKLKTYLEGQDPNADMISFNSPIAPPLSRGFDQIRPNVNVTVRQKLDLNAVADPFQSPPVASLPLDVVPIGGGSDNGLNFVQASNSLEEILNESRLASGGAEVILEDGADDQHSRCSSNNNKDFSEERENVQEKVSLQESAKESQNLEQNAEVKEKDLPTASQEEEESTSDLMDMLTIEEDTQDASIASDTRGMSSCEHAVSLN